MDAGALSPKEIVSAQALPEFRETDRSFAGQATADHFV